MSILMMTTEPIEVPDRMLQTFRVRCNGVDYVLFGPIISPPGAQEGDEIDLEIFEFCGLIQVEDLVNVLKKDPMRTTVYGELVQ